MDTSKLPKHVGLIVDGNRRWAKEKGFSPLYGHEVGIKNVLPKIIDCAFLLGVKEVSAWIFSTENWNRSIEEIDHLMRLFEELTNELKESSMNKKIQVHHVGRKDRLPKKLMENLEVLEKNTEGFSNRLNLCIDYGGKDEISRAVVQLLNSGVSSTDVTVDLIDNFVRRGNNFVNSPDLIIRTGGEQRTSGFMIWEGAYAELAFEKKYFPDFSPSLFKRWMDDYSSRSRRFGK